MVDLDATTSSTRRGRRIAAGTASLLTAAVILLLLRCGPSEDLPGGIAGAPGPAGLSGVSAGPPLGDDLGGNGAGPIVPVSGGVGQGGPASEPGVPHSADVGAAPVLASQERLKVGEVAAGLGAAAAGPPGSSLRTLDCGDPVYAGEHAFTAAGSRLGLLAGEVYIQLDPDTELTLQLIDAGALDLGLEAGRARIVDARSEGPAGRISVAGAQAALLDNDAEVRFYADEEAEEARGRGVLCARGGSLTVVGGGVRRNLAAGECVETRTEASVLAAADPREPILFPQSAEEECRTGEVIGAAAERFLPFDVAAPVDSKPLPNPQFPPPFPRDPCGDPSAPCRAEGTSSGPGGGPVDPPTEPPGGGPPTEPPGKPPRGPNANSFWMGPGHLPKGLFENMHSRAVDKFPTAQPDGAPACCWRKKTSQGPNKTQTSRRQGKNK